MVVAAYPFSRKSPRAASRTARWFCFASSCRRLESYRRLPLTGGAIRYILLYQLQSTVLDRRTAMTMLLQTDTLTAARDLAAELSDRAHEGELLGTMPAD